MEVDSFHEYDPIFALQRVLRHFLAGDRNHNDDCAGI